MNSFLYVSKLPEDWQQNRGKNVINNGYSLGPQDISHIPDSQCPFFLTHDIWVPTLLNEQLYHMMAFYDVF